MFVARPQKIPSIPGRHHTSPRFGPAHNDNQIGIDLLDWLQPCTSNFQRFVTIKGIESKGNNVVSPSRFRQGLFASLARMVRLVEWLSPL